MLIKKIHIKKFRGFKDIQFSLGENLTVIAGQNGTQKTTLIGLLSQPFSITERTDEDHPMKNEKPLCGGNYKSGFSEKFKISKVYDTVGSHEWTLFTTDEESPDFTTESIKRDQINIRFWRKGTRAKGSGFLQYPVIYLSLLRLFPIGEDKEINETKQTSLTAEEREFLNKWHKNILIIPDLKIENLNHLESKQKNTLAITSDYYDWATNSAGQDNLGKILLAILSFKRLKEKFPDDYKSGLLVIDEIDATLYPASQIKLLEFLRKMSSKYNIQIIFTSHSLMLIEEMSKLASNEKFKNQTKIIYLKKLDKTIQVVESPSWNYINNDLKVILSENGKPPKINVFTEDEEGEIFFKGLIKTRRSGLNFVKCTMGHPNYIELARKKVIGFTFPHCIICLDGDVPKNKIKGFKNIFILPGKDSPEKIFAKMLFDESEASLIWDKLTPGYNKQFCFRDYHYEDIVLYREKAKRWFRDQKRNWGSGNCCSRIINIWIEKNREEYDDFIQHFDKFVSTYKK